MSDVQSLTLEVLKQIRSELKDGLGGLRAEVQKTNERLDLLTGRVDSLNGRIDHLSSRVDNVKEMQDVLVVEHRKTNARLDFFAEELIRMRTRDQERLAALEVAVAELQRKVG